MVKLRVHELAKELNITSKEIIEKAKTANIQLASHMSVMEGVVIDKVRALLGATHEYKDVEQVKESKPATQAKPVEAVKQSSHRERAVHKHEHAQVIDKHHADPRLILDDNKNEKKQEQHHHHVELKGHAEKKNIINKHPNKMMEATITPSVIDLSKKERKKNRYDKRRQEEVVEETDEIKVLTMGDEITVKDLADKLEKPAVEIIKYLMGKGIFATINQSISYDIASNIAEKYEMIIEQKIEDDVENAVYCEDIGECELKNRPPVVVVMGHVDHGKTSLLDAIRETSVMEREHGGITQHIGASQVVIKNKKITFLDTPGHEAFTAMRLRGARVTDIAILVVAADDGVMPQTIEAINHAKAAGIPIIVAINKMDKPGANPDKVKQELTEHGLVSEEWGGETICVPLSAHTKDGIDTLLEMVLLVAEMGELRAAYDARAKGTVIEAKLDKARGVVATVLVDNGTLRIGDPILAGKTFGKVKAMVNGRGEKVKQATPSTPVEILGFNEVPEAGDTFYVTKDDKQAKTFAEKAATESREKRIVGAHKNVSLDALFTQIQTGEMKKLNLIIKADVQGSVEAIRQSMEKLSNQEVVVSVIHGGAGAITESDVMLAGASGAIIIGFNVIAQPMARKLAEENEVDLRLYRVIYNAIEDVEAAMKGMLDPEFKEKVIGDIEIRDVFKVTGVGIVAGSYIRSGYITRNSTIRVVRDGVIIHDGPVSSLKRFKDDAKEVKAGFECGILIEKFSDVKPGDSIEAYIMEEIKRV